MKTRNTFTRILPIVAGLFLFQSCNNDDNDPGMMNPDEPMPTSTTITYQLGSVDDPDISGTAKFIKFDDNSVTIELQLQNTPSGGQHPAHIHFNTAAEGGDIALTLGAVNGDDGTSTINITALEDGTPITYEELLEFDGYINVHESLDDLGTLLAQGDIGQNELTAESKVYALGSVDVDGIDGTATFTKRKNGEALAVIKLNNTPTDGMHPGHIHANTAAEGGDIVFDFLPFINGATGITKTNVAALKDGTPFLYDDVLAYDGYINIHSSMEDLGTLIAQGDIGQNELTGESKEYELAAVSNASIFGTASFAERVNGETLVTINLEGTTSGNSHPTHIHVR